MPKLSNSNKTIVKILLSVLLFTTVSVISLSLLSSLVIYKLDIDLKYGEYFTYIILSITSFLVPLLSLYSLKNNGIIMGILCMIPLIIYVLLNTIICDNSYLKLVMKIALIILFSGISGVLKTKKNRRFKVK